VAESYVALLREGYTAWNSGDREWVLEHMSPEIEWVTPPDDPEPGTYRGYEGVERFWANWRELFGLIRFDIQEMWDLGDQVLVHALRIGRGAQSGVEVTEPVYQLFSFGSDGRAVRVEEFYDREKAEAVAADARGRAQA
jgi:ketosteroid isomerase-like protein